MVEGIPQLLQYGAIGLLAAFFFGCWVWERRERIEYADKLHAELKAQSAFYGDVMRQQGEIIAHYQLDNERMAKALEEAAKKIGSIHDYMLTVKGLLDGWRRDR